MEPKEATEAAANRWANRIADALASGPAVGAVLAVLFFVAGTLSLDNLSYFGHASDDLRRLAIRIYGPQVAVEAARILALYLAVGLTGGLISSGLCGLRDRLRGARPRSLLFRISRHVLLLGTLHLYFLAHSMVVHPQLYAEAFYDRGGIRRQIQVLLTDWFSPALLSALLLGGLILWVLWPVGRLWSRLRWPTLRVRDGLAWAGALGLLAIALLAATLTTGSGRATDNRGPNLLILAVDSLRADRLEEPRYRRVAPRMRRLAAKSVMFTHNYTTLARTFPSWVTLLTGREPYDHGIRHMFPSWEARRHVGRGGLPQQLARAGWRTAVVSDYAGEIFGRIDLGFQHVDVSAFSFYEIVRQRVIKAHTNLLPYLATAPGQRLVPPMQGLPENADSRILAQRVNRMLDRVAQEKKFAVVAFFSSCHFPYAAPWPHYQTFTSRAYHGPYRYHKQRQLHEHEPSLQDVRHMRGLFDGAVATADEAIGHVLDHLKRLGIADRTIVVLTADHGENLYEADLGMGHGDHLRGENATRAPLIIYDPRRKGPARRVTSVVRDVDLAPTLAARLGVRLPQATGHDNTPLMQGRAPAKARPAFMETGLWFTRDIPGVGTDMRLAYPPVLGGLVTMDEKHQGDLVLNPQYETLVVAAKHRAIRTNRWKLIYVPLASRVRYLLYDLKRDPDCTRDVARKHPEVVTRLSRRLTRWMRRAPGALQVGRYVLPGQGATP